MIFTCCFPSETHPQHSTQDHMMRNLYGNVPLIRILIRLLSSLLYVQKATIQIVTALLCLHWVFQVTNLF